MNVLNLSTLRLNDSHSYFGGAIGNIAYNALAGLARQPGVSVVSAVEDVQLEHEPPADLRFVRVDGTRDLRRFADRASREADVAMHYYLHEPEFSAVADIPERYGVPFVLAGVEAPHPRFADERDGLERIGPLRTAGKAVLKRVMARTFDCANGVAFVNRQARTHYAGHVDDAEASVIPYPVDTDRFAPGEGAAEPRVLCVSRLIRRRRLDTLIGAVARVRRRVPGVELDLVGEGEYRPALEGLARRHGIADIVTFHGRVDDVAPLYRRASVYAHCSGADGWNQTALEAMASGTPVVCTEAGHNSMVVDGETGYRVPVGDVRATAAAIGDLLDGGAMRQRYGRAARERAVDEYAVDAIGERLAEWLDGQNS